MAGDFNKPATTDTYTAFASAVRDLAADLAKGLDPAVVSAVNIPTNTVRWTSALSKWQKYNGSTWIDLSSLYAISISGNAATATSATSAGAVPWSGVSSKPTTVGGYGITDMSSQVVSKASHLVGGVVGNIPYQSAAGVTAMLAAGTAGYILKANGAAAPSWVAQNTLSVGTAAACSGNAATATTAAACSGNAATATTAATCSGNAATATTAADGVGVGQTWQDVTSSRSAGPSYTNSTARPILVKVSATLSGTAAQLDIVAGGVLAQSDVGNNLYQMRLHVSALVLPGQIYAVGVSAAAVTRWTELR